MTKLCAFSTANDAYVPQAAASLLGIRHWNKTIPLYIISSKLSRHSKKLLDTYDIHYIETDLSSTFTRTWDYPLECFYLFAGPQLLAEEGFTHSLYIDGDIYCNGDPLLPLGTVTAIAGIANGTIKQILGDDYKKAVGSWNVTATPDQRRLQSGVVYFNNAFCAKIDLLNTAGDLFQRALAEGMPRKGDDSLFALLQLVRSDIRYTELDPVYNFITRTRSTDDEWLTRHDTLINSAVFYHFTNGFPKPWTPDAHYPDFTYKYFADKWRQRLVDTFAPKDLKRFFPDINALLSDAPLRFYSWPSDNVGDLVTPYFLSKVGKVSPLGAFSISEEEIMAIERGESPRHKKKLFRRQKQPGDGAAYSVSTGSVIRLCGNRALVYGSGIRSADQEVHASHVRSVRGPLTRGRFLQEGFGCPPVYGDPGLLLPRFYTPRRTAKKYTLGIMPHFTEYETVVKLYADDKDTLVINMGCGDLEKVISQLVSCRETVASSLHGLVFSHAYKIPTRRITFSDGIYGDGTKFYDYYAGIGLTPYTMLDASRYTKISAAKLRAAKKEELKNFDDTRLLDAMFFNEDGLRPSARYPY